MLVMERKHSAILMDDFNAKIDTRKHGEYGVGEWRSGIVVTYIRTIMGMSSGWIRNAK